MKLTQRELFQATVNHKKEDGILFYAYFIGEAVSKIREHYHIPDDQSPQEFFDMYRPCGIKPKLTDNLPKYDYSAYYEDIEIPEKSEIAYDGVLHIQGSTHHFSRMISPLRNASTLADLESFPWDFLDPENYSAEHMKTEIEAVQSKGLVAFSSIGRFYENAWQYRGYEELLMDMLADPDMADFIFDKLFAYNMFAAKAAANAGADYVTSGDDVANQNNMMFSLDTWRYFQKSRWSKIYAEVKRINPNIKIWYHSDGNITDILDDLVEIGVDIINPIQPECMDPFEVKKRYGDKITIDGAIGTQTVLPFGSPADVCKAVKEAVDILGANGGYILSPSHFVEPEVPVENIDAFVKTARQYNR